MFTKKFLVALCDFVEKQECDIWTNSSRNPRRDGDGGAALYPISARHPWFEITRWRFGAPRSPMASVPLGHLTRDASLSARDDAESASETRVRPGLSALPPTWQALSKRHSRGRLFGFLARQLARMDADVRC